MARTTERWARQQMDDRTYDDTMASLREAERSLAISLADLREAAHVRPPGEIVRLGEKLLGMWPRMNGSQRNRALRDLVEKVVISAGPRQRRPADERVEVLWRGC